MQYCVYMEFAGWKPEVWAAWVQAIGSIAAILAAYWLARRAEISAQRQREADAAIKAKSKALALVTPLQLYGNAIRPAVEEVYTPASYRRHAATIDLPPMLMEAAESLHELGKAAEPFLKFIRLQQVAQRAMHFVIELDDAGLGGAEIETYEDAAHDRLQELYLATGDALDAMNRMLDSKPR